MKKISEIYTDYRIMPNLQEHMFRVAAVACLISDSTDFSVDKNKVIGACLLHDMGNIIKAHLEYFPQFNEPEGIEYWRGVKDEYIKKYGENEEVANHAIIQELGFKDLLDTLLAFGFRNTLTNLQNPDYAKKICFYSDLRVAPLGVVSIKERLKEGRERYAKRKSDLIEADRDLIENAITELEKEIFSRATIKPEDITDEAVASIIESLKDFVIK